MLSVRTLFVCLLAASSAVAESRALILEHPREDARPRASAGRKLWKWSVAALAAGSAVDAMSSWGHREANPLLRGPDGRFSARGIGLKAAIAGSAVAAQWALQRKNPGAAKGMAFANFGMAGTFTGAAVYNQSIKK